MSIKTAYFWDDHFTFGKNEYEMPHLLALFRVAHALSTPPGTGRVMPRWMIVDLALMSSGALLALAGQEHLRSVARKLERNGQDGAYPKSREKAAVLRDLLRHAYDRGYSGPLPVAGYAAIPTSDTDCWLGGSLWWSHVPGARLGYSVRRIALECYGADYEVGVTQFDNIDALRAQRRFGKLRVTHTTLAVHPSEHTFIYQVNLKDLPKDGSPAPPVPPPEKPYVLNRDDPNLDELLENIQQEIKAGANYYIAAPLDDGKLSVIYADGRRPTEPATPTEQGTPSAGEEAQDSWFAPGIRAGNPYKAYIISTSEMFSTLELAPFGIALETIDICGPDFTVDGQKHDVPKLLEMLIRAIALGYAESGMGTPRWAMVELAMLPSAVLVVMAGQEFLRETADKLAREPVTDLRRTRLIPLGAYERDRLRNAHALLDLLQAATDSGYTGPLPVAGYAAAPTPQPGRWVGWSLWSLVPGTKLGYTVKRLALACYKVRTQGAAIRFDVARSLNVITKFGMPRVMGVDVHAEQNSIIYDLEVGKLPADGAPVSDASRSKVSWQFDPEKELAESLQIMQHGTERAIEYFLLAQSDRKARSRMVPIHQRRVLRRVPGWYARSLAKRLTHAKRALLRRIAQLRGLPSLHSQQPSVGQDR